MLVKDNAHRCHPVDLQLLNIWAHHINSIIKNKNKTMAENVLVCLRNDFEIFINVFV